MVYQSLLLTSFLPAKIINTVVDLNCQLLLKLDFLMFVGEISGSLHAKLITCTFDKELLISQQVDATFSESFICIQIKCCCFFWRDGFKHFYYKARNCGAFLTFEQKSDQQFQITCSVSHMIVCILQILTDHFNNKKVIIKKQWTMINWQLFC